MEDVICVVFIFFIFHSSFFTSNFIKQYTCNVYSIKDNCIEKANVVNTR